MQRSKHHGVHTTGGGYLLLDFVTKCGNVFVDGVTYRRDGSAAGIRRQCEDSLRNLRTDYVDLMLIHWPDPNTPFAETMAELTKLKEEGKIRHVGVSNFSQAQMEEAGQYCPIEAYQPQYSMVSTGNTRPFPIGISPKDRLKATNDQLERNKQRIAEY